MAESTNPNGIQILVPAQYTDAYKISTYGGVPAMVTKPNSVQLIWLDKEFDRPEFLPSDIANPIKTNEIGTSDFKINMHLGYPGGKKVGNWSEDGSQVFATADELKDFFSNCEKHRELYENSFSYTLVTKDDWDTAVKNVEANKGAKNTIPEKQIPAVEKQEASIKETSKPAETEAQLSFYEYEKIVKEIEIIYNLVDNTYTQNSAPLFKDFKNTFQDDVEGAIKRLEETLGISEPVKQKWYGMLDWNNIKDAEQKKLFKEQFEALKSVTRSKKNKFDFSLPVLSTGEAKKYITIKADF